MRQSLLTTLVVASVAGCTTTPANDTTPRAEVVLADPLPPSEVASLGVDELVDGGGPDAERLVRRATHEVAACLRPALEREPTLDGAMILRVDLAARAEARADGGELAQHPATGCVAKALGAIGEVPASARGQSLVYALRFGGRYKAAPIRDEADVVAHWTGFDWSSPDGAAPRELATATAPLAEPLRRCGFGAKPELAEELWLALRVKKGGAIDVAVAGADRSDDAARCLRRVVGAAKLPDAGHDYAVSVTLFPETARVRPSPDATADALEFGMTGLLNPGAGGAAPNDAFGAGGLGLTGIGGGESIGLGSIGTIGHGGMGHGFGPSGGRLGTNPAAPKVRMGATSVSGRLPPEVIQRIVRQNFGRFRLCYETALKKDPKLEGRVSVSFEIARDGSSGKVKPTSELKDKTFVACIGKGFAGLTFPQPEGGIVKVTYPIQFAPGDDAAAPAAAPKPPTVGGKTIDALSLSDVAARLSAKSLPSAGVPGFATTEAPMLFARPNASAPVVVVTLGAPRKPAGVEVCSVGTGDQKRLELFGAGCSAVRDALLD